MFESGEWILLLSSRLSYFKVDLSFILCQSSSGLFTLLEVENKSCSCYDAYDSK